MVRHPEQDSVTVHFSSQVREPQQAAEHHEAEVIDCRTEDRPRGRVRSGPGGRSSSLPPAEQGIARKVDEASLARLDWEAQPSDVVRLVGAHLDHDLPFVLAGETAVKSMSRILQTVDHGLRGAQGAGTESQR